VTSNAVFYFAVNEVIFYRYAVCGAVRMNDQIVSLTAEPAHVRLRPRKTQRIITGFTGKIIGYQILTVANFEHESIQPGAATEIIISGTSVDNISTRPAAERVISGTAAEKVVTGSAVKSIITHTAVQHISPVPSVDPVIPRCSVERDPGRRQIGLRQRDVIKLKTVVTSNAVFYFAVNEVIFYRYAVCGAVRMNDQIVSLTAEPAHVRLRPRKTQRIITGFTGKIIGYQILTVANFEHESIQPGAATEIIISGTSVDNISTRPAAERVISGTAAKMIIFCTTRKRIITRGTVVGYPGRRHSERDIFFLRGIIC